MIEKTDKGYRIFCDICNWEAEAPDREAADKIHGTHFGSKEHKKKVKEKGKEEEEMEGEGEVEGEVRKEKKLPSIEELSPQDAILYYGEDEVINYYKRKKLQEFLETAPQVSAKQTEWIMVNYDSDERAKVDPNSLYSLLLQSRLDPQLAYRIVQNLVDMEQKLRLKMGRQPVIPFPPVSTPQVIPSPPLTWQQPQPWQQMQPWIQPLQYPYPQYPYYYPHYPQLYQYFKDDRVERLEKELKELRERKIEVREEKEVDERYVKLESTVEELKKQREREEQEKREREREERWSREISELKESIKSMNRGEVITVSIPLRDSSGNIITGPDGKPVQQMFQGPPSYIQALIAQHGSGATITPERLQVLIGSEIDKRLKSGGISKEELERILEERESKRAWKELQEDLKELRKEIEKREKERPLSGISEPTQIEIKKLDLIGNKLDQMHETVKKGMELVLTERAKPRERTLEDITKLDEELSTIAKTGE